MASFSDGAQWPSDNAKLQPVHITLDIVHDISHTASTDDLTHSIDYSAISKTLTKSCGSTTFTSLESLCDSILESTFQLHDQVQEVAIRITRSRALLHPATTGIRASRTRGQSQHSSEEFILSGLEYRAIVGINDCEREDTQVVRFDLELSRPIQRSTVFRFRELERQLHSVSSTLVSFIIC